MKDKELIAECLQKALDKQDDWNENLIRGMQGELTNAERLYLQDYLTSA